MQMWIFSKHHIFKYDFWEKTQYSNMNFWCFLFTPDLSPILLLLPLLLCAFACAARPYYKSVPRLPPLAASPVPSIRPLRLAPDLPRQLAPPLFLAAITTVPTISV